MQILLLYLIVIAIILVTLTVHELGHFFAAKIFNVNIKELSIGIGPKLFQWQTKKDLKVSLRLLPVMAFVMLDSHAVRELYRDDKSSKKYCKYIDVIPKNKMLLEDTKQWQYLTIMLSGVAANLILFFISWPIYYGCTIADPIVLYRDPFCQFGEMIIGLGKNMALQGEGSAFGQIPSIPDSKWPNPSQWAIIFVNMLMNLNLFTCIFNIVPIPPLDGYKCVVRTYKDKTKKKVNEKFEAILIIICLLALVWMTISCFIVDIINSTNKETVAGFIGRI